MFVAIAAEREHVCEVCGVTLHELRHWNFSHLLPKGTYPDLQLDPRNIRLQCFDCHEQWHNNPGACVRDTRWAETITLRAALKRECYVKP